jgi:prepilin-type N-terminal cleavage/methylation domain-containing protein
MIPPIVNDDRRRTPRGAQGFTVVELVIVMAVLVIMVGIVAPRLQISASRRVEGMAHQIVAQLEMARSNALGKRLMTEVVFDESDRTYTAYVDYDRDGNIQNNDAEVAAFPEFAERELEMFVNFGRGNASPVPGDVSLDAVTLPDATLYLSVQGVPDPWGTMGTVYLVHRDDPDAVMAISIASSGSFKAWRWSPGGEEWR